MRHLMLDIETLGTEPGSIILSIGAVEFSTEYGVKKEFFRAIDTSSSLLAGFSFSTSTISWWSAQDVQAQQLAFFAPGKMPVKDALEDFSKIIDKNTLIWAKGPDFDCVLLEAAYRKIGLQKPWSYRNTRDVRTILALAGMHSSKAELKHSPVADAEAQAMDVLAAAAILGVVIK